MFFKNRHFWIKWLVILAVVFVLAGLAIPDIGQGIPYEGSMTKGLLSTLKTGCENYVTEYGVLPASSENYVLVDILTGKNPRAISFLTIPPKYLNPNKEVVDAWGPPFRITLNPKDSRITVLSAGKDRLFGTRDDITTDR